MFKNRDIASHLYKKKYLLSDKPLILHFQGLELSVRVGKKSGASRFTSSFSQSGPVNVSPID